MLLWLSTEILLFTVWKDFRNAVESASDEAGRPVLPDGVLNQIIRYLPQLQLINKDLLKDLQARINNW